MVAYICSLNVRETDTEDCCKLQTSLGEHCLKTVRHIGISEKTQHHALEERSDTAVHSPCHAGGRPVCGMAGGIHRHPAAAVSSPSTSPFLVIPVLVHSECRSTRQMHNVGSSLRINMTVLSVTRTSVSRHFSFTGRL